MNRSPVDGPWGGGAHFFRAMVDHSRHTIMHERNATATHAHCADVVVIAGLDPDANGIGINWAYHPHNPKIVYRVNDCDARKGTTSVDRMIGGMATRSDGVVWVSNWLQKHMGHSRGRVIVNGVEPNVKKEHSGGPLRIVVHHWSDNRAKGADIHEHIDALCTLFPGTYTQTFIGRHRCNFKSTQTVGPLFGQALRDELVSHDVYVSASRWDPGPNHILEGLAAGLPVFVHADGGGAVEFAGRDAAYHDWEDLYSRLVTRTFPTNTGHVALNDWATVISQYDDYIDEVAGA